MTDHQNETVRLIARPVGLPKTTDFSFETGPVQPLGDGEVLLQTLYISLDPAMRGWMSEAKSYLPPVQLGDVMRALAASRVIESRDPLFSAGDLVTGATGLQTRPVVSGAMLTKMRVTDEAELPRLIGALGMPGMTAYFGLLDVGAMKEGETVVVSGAAGAVGSVVGQIARIKGGRAVGIAGGPEKCRYLVEELGFDAAIDYREGPIGKRLRAACPDGIDVYFDNVGGEILDACLAQLNRKARVAICGAISQYNATDGVRGPANYLSLLVNRARMEGFIVFDFADRYPEAVKAMSQWIAEGKLKTREDIVEGGLTAFPETLGKLFTGENFGKLILKV